MDHKASLQTEIKENFGELNSRQLWALVKLSKFVRLRARNNTAFNNAFNQIFPNARFNTVNKTRNDRYTGRPVTYPGLQIVVQGETAPLEVDESDE